MRYTKTYNQWSEWKPWFAWHPVAVPQENLGGDAWRLRYVVFEWVERRKKRLYSRIGDLYVYEWRLSKKISH